MRRLPDEGAPGASDGLRESRGMTNEECYLFKLYLSYYLGLLGFGLFFWLLGELDL